MHDEPRDRVLVVREIPLPVGQMHGVIWDGEAVWCVDGAVPRLVRVHPENGRILGVLTGFAADAGTAFDGQYLWQIGGDRLRKIDRASGRVIGELQLPDDGVSGLSWASGRFWVGNHRGKHLLEIDAVTGKVLDRRVYCRQRKHPSPYDGKRQLDRDPFDRSCARLCSVGPVAPRDLRRHQRWVRVWRGNGAFARTNLVSPRRCMTGTADELFIAYEERKLGGR